MASKVTIRIKRKRNWTRRIIVLFFLAAAAAAVYSAATGKFLSAAEPIGEISVTTDRIEVRSRDETELLLEGQKKKLFAPSAVTMWGGQAEIALAGGDRLRLRGKGILHIQVMENRQGELEFDATGVAVDGYFEKTPLSVKCGRFRVVPMPASSISITPGQSDSSVTVKSWFKGCDVLLPSAGTIHMDDGGSGYEKGFQETSLDFDVESGGVAVRTSMMNRTKEIWIGATGQRGSASLGHGGTANIDRNGYINVVSAGERIAVAAGAQCGSAGSQGADVSREPGPASGARQPAPPDPAPGGTEPSNPAGAPGTDTARPEIAGNPASAAGGDGDGPRNPADPPAESSPSAPEGGAVERPAIPGEDLPAIPERGADSSANPALNPKPATDPAPTGKPDSAETGAPTPEPGLKPSKAGVSTASGVVDSVELKPRKEAVPAPGPAAGGEKPRKEKQPQFRRATPSASPPPPPLADRELQVCGEGGEIVIRRDAGEVTVKRGRVRLARGDVVRVRQGCFARINIGSGVVVTVAENTEFRIP